MQEIEGIKPLLRRLVGNILLVDVLTFLLVGGIAFIRKQMHVLFFANGLAWAGVILMALGVLGVVGNYIGTRNYKFTFGQSAGQQTLPERTQRLAVDLLQSFRFAVLMILSSIVPFLVGVILGFSTP